MPLLTATIVVAPLSCASTAPSPLSYAVQRTGQSRPEAMDAAEVVLTQLGYQIASRDTEEGVLITRPLDAAPGDPRSRPGAGLSSNAPMRRVIEVRLEATPGGTRVYCRVAIQEQATQAYQMFQAAKIGEDTPGQTAIDRDAAGSVAQNTVWRTVARDKRAERDVLAAVLARAGGAAGGGP